MSEVVYNSKFYGDDKLRDYNIFAEEYFSGSDIKLIANGVEIKEISYIQFELLEQLKPIFGYNSYIYDDIAVGSRIVNGTFACPVKNVYENETFKCPPTSKYAKGVTVDIRDYEYQVDSEVSTVSNEEYSYYVDYSDLYLSPNMSINIGTIVDKEVIVKDEVDDFLLVYDATLNKVGYIRK